MTGTCARLTLLLPHFAATVPAKRNIVRPPSRFTKQAPLLTNSIKHGLKVVLTGCTVLRAHWA